VVAVVNYLVVDGIPRRPKSHGNAVGGVSDRALPWARTRLAADAPSIRLDAARIVRLRRRTLVVAEPGDDVESAVGSVVRVEKELAVGK
jgi:hypothetical protein